MPFVRIAGYDAVGASASVPTTRDPAASLLLSERFSAYVRNHDLKVGAELRRTVTTATNDTGSRGLFYFDSLEDFLVGNVAIGRLTGGASRRRMAQNFGSLFVQDTIRLTTELTLSLGLRWEYAGVPSERDHNLFAFLPESGGLVQVESPDLPAIYQRDANNFAPRLGFAFAPGNDPRFAVRAGYSLTYIHPTAELFLRQTAPNTLAAGAAYAPRDRRPSGPSPATTSSGTAPSGVCSRSSSRRSMSPSRIRCSRHR